MTREKDLIGEFHKINYTGVAVAGRVLAGVVHVADAARERVDNVSVEQQQQQVARERDGLQTHEFSCVRQRNGRNFRIFASSV